MQRCDRSSTVQPLLSGDCNIMFRRSSSLAYAVVCLLGLTIIGAAWAYGGRLFPQRRPGLSAYDAAAYYVELAIWGITLISGFMLVISLRYGRRS